MKKRAIIIAAVILVLFALMHLATGRKAKTDEKAELKEAAVSYVPVLEVQNKMRSFYLEAYGQLAAGQTLDIAFEVSGKLQQGALRLRPGVKFSQGQLLYSVDAEEANYALSARKSGFITLISQVMPDIKLDYADEFQAWDSYLNQIDINKTLPALPEVKSSKLRFLLNQRNIFAEFNNIKSQELRLRKHKYYAPFSGTVTDVFLEPGSIINASARIASALRTGDYELKIPIAIEDLDMYKSKGSVDVLDASGKIIGTGRLTRVSDVINRMTQSLDAYFSIQPAKGVTLYNGMYVNIKLNKETYGEVMALPYLAVKGQTVRVIQDSTVIEKPVEIVASFPDTVLVKGLQNKWRVLISSADLVSDTVKVVGIPK